MTSGYRPSWWILFTSLLFHAIGIGLLMTVHSFELLPARPRSVTWIAPRHVDFAPVVSQRSLRRPIPREPRAFHISDRLPRPAAQPQETSIVPDPPLLLSQDAHSPESIPQFLELPPPPVRRVVAVIGAFDRTIPSNQVVAHTEITTGAFSDASIAAAKARLSQNAPPVIFSAAEILSKPHPAYTDDARDHQIEGEVLLEVLFAASGETRVLRVIRGLGHGLDETAIAAARDIRFRAATRGGADVDSMAVVHIVFQLAH